MPFEVRFRLDRQLGAAEEAALELEWLLEVGRRLRGRDWPGRQLYGVAYIELRGLMPELGPCKLQQL